jgi:hypothetical protein
LAAIESSEQACVSALRQDGRITVKPTKMEVVEMQVFVSQGAFAMHRTPAFREWQVTLRQSSLAAG